MSALPRAVRWDAPRATLVLLDQTKLPNQTQFIEATDPEHVFEAIVSLRVRGAPAIGLAAAWGVVLGLQRDPGPDAGALGPGVRRVVDRLGSSRPTAVNLRWALDRMVQAWKALPAPTPRSQVLETLEGEAQRIQDEDEAMGLRLAEAGLTLLQPGWGILTHCNAGSIATARWGTALAPLHLGQDRGYGFKVWADETRPLLQGSRLTAWELQQAGVDVTVLCDNMAASVMAAGRVQAVVVGCDRVAANGDVANKIGTLGLAVLAHHFRIPFYVFAPTSTLDPTCPTGADIPIEERSRDEVVRVFGSAPVAPEGVSVFNPAFDVTPASLVTALVTDRGIVRPPYDRALQTLQEVLHG